MMRSRSAVLRGAAERLRRLGFRFGRGASVDSDAAMGYEELTATAAVTSSGADRGSIRARIRMALNSRSAIT